MDSFSSKYLDGCREALEEEQSRSLAATNYWEKVDRALVHRDWDALYLKIAPLVDSAAFGSEQVQSLIAAHYDIACRFYVPTARAYVGMALHYQENADMAAFHNAYQPGLAAFLADAMSIYARTTLT
ncbi:transcriptional regulator [Cryobacterium sinapicolor]|uniref:Transcriptional regulator n=1 Tax=Cryobacterium sinapicolor TaxID=1259236 RepID=A0ABY2J756_9MICO|nr:transcriptional regulator [Cryobacterium sp. TMT3-29-2]TFD00665.1 transcriptional regulator [Cryobacterium sinapicolor]